MNQVDNNRKVGIIGGVGPQATQFIYGKIIELSQSKYGAKNNNDYPQILIESVPVPDFISDTTQIEVAKKMLIESVQSLTKAGATRLCIGSNTVHILLDELRKNTEVQFISMIELVAKKCIKHSFSKVGLLGTPVLIKSGLYEQELKKYNIELVLPTESEIEIADSIIRDVLAGQKSFDKKQEYIKALNDLFSRGAQAIILGCTELPLAINYEALGNRTISSDEVLAEGIVDYYYNSNE
jgi:aspartate racemase